MEAELPDPKHVQFCELTSSVERFGKRLVRDWNEQSSNAMMRKRITQAKNKCRIQRNNTPEELPKQRPAFSQTKSAVIAFEVKALLRRRSAFQVYRTSRLTTIANQKRQHDK